MAIETAADLIRELESCQLIDPTHIDLVSIEMAPQFPLARDLTRELVKRGWLTTFQANRLVQGQGQSLVFREYRLLDRLGEGGMGAVFKAQHSIMDRTVALKVIKKDHSITEDTLRRFRQEIRAAAKVSHTNIVQAFEAFDVGGQLCLVMEYVEGTDLGHMLKERGRLGALEACEYIRQAALGL